MLSEILSANVLVQGFHSWGLRINTSNPTGFKTTLWRGTETDNGTFFVKTLCYWKETLGFHG